MINNKILKLRVFPVKINHVDALAAVSVIWYNNTRGGGSASRKCPSTILGHFIMGIGS